MPNESDTPRTDSAANDDFMVNHEYSAANDDYMLNDESSHPEIYVAKEFAQELERELNEFKKMMMHAFIHTAHTDCGFLQMTTAQKRRFVALLRENEMAESADRLEIWIDTEQAT